jgi:hypothetical protein
MALTEVPSRLLPLAEELLDNRYARDHLREGGERLQDAFRRAQKRRVTPSRCRRIRRQLESAIAALDEGTAALASGRRKPRHRGRKVVLALLALAGIGAAAVLAGNEDLRRSVLGSARALGEEICGDPGTDGSAS